MCSRIECRSTGATHRPPGVPVSLASAVVSSLPRSPVVSLASAVVPMRRSAVGSLIGAVVVLGHVLCPRNVPWLIVTAATVVLTVVTVLWVVTVPPTGSDQRHSQDDRDDHQQDQLRSVEARHSAQRSSELEGPSRSKPDAMPMKGQVNWGKLAGACWLGQS